MPNRAPAAVGAIPARTVTVGATATVDASAHFSDPDGDALFYAASSSNAGVASVTMDMEGGVATVTGVAKGEASVSVTARDAYGLSATLSFSVVVPNRAPTATDSVPEQSVFVGESISVDLSARFSDPDGDALVFAAASSNEGTVAVTVDGGAATVAGVGQGEATVTATASDPGGLSAELAFVVAVPNQAPVAGAPIPERSVFVGESISVDLSAHFSDPDGDALTYAAASSNEGTVAVTVAGGVATVAGIGQGEATLTVAASDPGGLSAELVFAATVPNRAPIAAAPIPEQSVFVGESISVDLSAHFSDPDGDGLVYAAASSDEETVAVTVDGGVAIVAGVGQGEATLMVAASDAHGLSAELVFAATVPNRAPIAAAPIPEQSVFVGESISLDLSAHLSDPDGDALVFAAASSRARVVAVSVEGPVATVAGVARGTATVTAAASDPAGLFATLSFSVAVPNRAPVATDSLPARSLRVGDSASVDLGDRFADPDGDRLTYSASSANADVAAVSVADGAATVIARAPGSTAVVLKARDSSGGSAELAFVVTVTPAETKPKSNRPPVARGIVPVQSLLAGSTFRLDLGSRFVDPDGDALTYAASSAAPAVASVSVVGRSVSVLGRTAGAAGVRATATDPGGLSAHLDFVVLVEGEAQPGPAIQFGADLLELEAADSTHESFQGDVVVANVGDKAVGPVTLTIGAARLGDGNAVSGVTLRVEPAEIPTLNPGARTTVDVTAQLPPNAREGIYRSELDARAGNGDARASLDVRFRVQRRPGPPAVGAGVVIAEGNRRIRQGDVVRYSAQVRNEAGAVVPDARVSWSVRPADAGLLDANGRFVAYAAGDLRIVATADLRAGGRVRRDSAVAWVVVDARGISQSLRVLGTGAVVDRRTSDLWVHGDHAYTGTWNDRPASGMRTGNVLYAWKLDANGLPTLTDSIVVSARTVNDVKIRADGRLGVLTHEGDPSRRNGVTFFDLADPARPRVVSRFTTGLATGVHNAWLDGDHAYLALTPWGSGLRVLDVSDPKAPRMVGSYYAGRSFLHDVHVRDGIAFLSHWDAGLVVLDVGGGTAGGSPSRPVELSRVDLGGLTHNVWYWPDAEYAFVGDEKFGYSSGANGMLRVLDVSDLSRPRQVATYGVPGASSHNYWLDEDEEILYLAWYEKGVRALDVGGELVGELDRQGREVGFLRYGADTTSCWSGPAGATCTFSPQLHGGKLYLSDMKHGLVVLDPGR